jgi:hypothetical protein
LSFVLNEYGSIGGNFQMTLTFVMLGLVCNSIGCYWATIDDKKFNDQQECINTARAIRQKSIMYFDTSCIVYDNSKASSADQ